MLLLCMVFIQGSIMAEDENTAMQNRFITFGNGSDSSLIIKVAQDETIAEYEHHAFKKFKRIKDNHYKSVLAVIHSPDSKIATYTIKDGSIRYKIKKPELIFRMPNSPLITFVIVDLQNPGILESISQDKTLLHTLNLETIKNELIDLTLSVRDNGKINHSGLPHFVYGTIRNK